ncbi:hypothetical protein GJ496_000189 [Pomphorhynchus laevis]|nr:hypothetical protein GJ496_000189 [Pomphorhynchus laevis]
MDAANTSSVSDYIKLISSDEHEFFIGRNQALSASTTLKNMFAGLDILEGDKNEVTLKEFSSYILYHLCRYFTYRSHYADSMSEIPNFNIDPNVMVELLIASDFMDC